MVGGEFAASSRKRKSEEKRLARSTGVRRQRVKCSPHAAGREKAKKKGLPGALKCAGSGRKFRREQQTDRAKEKGPPGALKYAGCGRKFRRMQLAERKRRKKVCREH